ncbi:MAG: YbaN family protein [bacterium]
MITKYLLITAGIISLILGTIGVFLPLLPTTPFLLLSAACFIRSSEKLYNWLIDHKLFGRYIENYIKHRAVSIKLKVCTIALLWATISISILSIDIIWVRILLVIIALGVTTHLLMLKTMDKIQVEEIID